MGNLCTFNFVMKKIQSLKKMITILSRQQQNPSTCCDKIFVLFSGRNTEEEMQMTEFMEVYDVRENHLQN